jgi:predicted RNA-binding protein YlqC (UPF0109 family)
MKELLTYIVQSLVDHPDEVSVTEKKSDGETVFEVRVADGDMGKVIGRQGRIVKQIRILMRAVAQRKGFLETGGWLVIFHDQPLGTSEYGYDGTGGGQQESL